MPGARLLFSVPRLFAVVCHARFLTLAPFSALLASAMRPFISCRQPLMMITLIGAREGRRRLLPRAELISLFDFTWVSLAIDARFIADIATRRFRALPFRQDDGKTSAAASLPAID